MNLQETGRRARNAIIELQNSAIREEGYYADHIQKIPLSHRASARNLAHYLALRQHDIRELQDDLAFLGLSSLGRAESCAMATLERVRLNLIALLGETVEDGTAEDLLQSVDWDNTVDSHTGPQRLATHTVDLMGHLSDRGRQTRIMVTMPSEAATDPTNIRDLLEAGMDIMRVNSAHDSAVALLAMVGHLRQAEADLGLACRVLVDLGGPKVRTGAMKPLMVKPGEHITLGAAAQIPCTLPEVFQDVQVGHRVWFDDGKIGAVVRVVEHVPEGIRLVVEIVQAKQEGSRLKAEKGINLPDTNVAVMAMTAEDEAILRTVVSNVDLVGLSFVRSEADVLQLFDALDAAVTAGNTEASALPGVILKIETSLGFENLPAILMTAMQRPPIGVMVARGDLAVEVGYERLAEIQEEILWICEAAHVPVIWATQVLDGMAKKGRPTRAEVSDAAMSGRAECVMLNKGPFVVDAVRFLSDILVRMAAHQNKKRSLLRRLQVSEQHHSSIQAKPLMQS